MQKQKDRAAAQKAAMLETAKGCLTDNSCMQNAKSHVAALMEADGGLGVQRKHNEYPKTDHELQAQ
eukprot:2953379-Rhodomonas_salina.1